MQHSLDRVEELTQALNSFLPMKSEWQKKLDQKFRLEFNYNSNHMEGNTLTYSETELLLIFDETKGNHTLREYEEMKAHDLALQLVKGWAADKERPLTEANIKELNRIILVKPFWKEAITQDRQKTRRLIKVGDYKEFPNSVLLSNGEIFEYASVTDTPILMRELIDWYRSEEKSLHPVTLAAMLHYKFVRIHPFDDGNGRIARMLMNYVLFKNDLPPVVIKSVDKANYLSVLRVADTGNNEEIISYIAEQLYWSLKLSIKAAKGGNVEEADDLDKEIELLRRSQNPVREKIKKSRSVILKLLKEVYFPLIQKTDSELSKFNPLFKGHSWCYFEEPQPPKYGVPIAPKSSALKVMLEYFLSIPDARGDSFHHFKASYWLKEYNDQNDFNIEVAFKLNTYDDHYNIEVVVGEPLHSSWIAQSLSKTFEKFSKEKGPFALLWEYELPSKEYSEVMFESEMNELVKQIKRETFEAINKKAKEKTN